jgi:diguanylate cyclase (GGDEF)-like protein
MNDPLVGMAVAGLLLGYALGMVAGVSIRPATCLASLALAIAPPILAFGAHLVVTGVYPVAAIVAAQAFLIAALATTTFAAVRHVHDAILRQLLAERELAALSGRDSLTGLPNRSLLRVRFAEAVSRLGETGEILAIHCLDLDHFQAVNDSLGRPAGDALLQAVAERLARALRAEDTAARMSGDEFVVIQTAIRDADQALLLAERIIETIGARYQIDGREVEIGVSFGIALAPRDGIDLDQLTSRADTALHQAKREKRPVVFWGEGAERGGAAPAARERLVVTGLD